MDDGRVDDGRVDDGWVDDGRVDDGRVDSIDPTKYGLYYMTFYNNKSP